MRAPGRPGAPGSLWRTAGCPATSTPRLGAGPDTTRRTRATTASNGEPGTICAARRSSARPCRWRRARLTRCPRRPRCLKLAACSRMLANSARSRLKRALECSSSALNCDRVAKRGVPSLVSWYLRRIYTDCRLLCKLSRSCPAFFSPAPLDSSARLSRSDSPPRGTKSSQRAAARHRPEPPSHATYPCPLKMPPPTGGPRSPESTSSSTWQDTRMLRAARLPRDA